MTESRDIFFENIMPLKNKVDKSINPSNVPVGYKIPPPAEVRVRSDPLGILPASDLRRHLSDGRASAAFPSSADG